MPIEWEKTIFHDTENTVIYNDKIKEVCEKNNIRFISLINELKKEDILDGIHPNETGHEKIFAKIRDFLAENQLL